ncbi:hypothetical protein TKK_0015648 [Trichogramma kaykai]
MPFIDDSGLLRIEGRLQNAILEHSEKHPVILPGDSPLIQRYIEFVHELTLHGGIQLMRSHLGQSVWITNGLRVIRGIYQQCITCVRYQASPENQQMAPLPDCCVKPARLFEVSGVDFAGPFEIRATKVRVSSTYVKAYMCIFVCMLTKAVHIEVVTGLTTDDFLAAYARFTGRRGMCRIIYSDNATTFKAASKELASQLLEVLQMPGGIVNQVRAKFQIPLQKSGR